MAPLKSIEMDERTIDGASAGVRKVKISLSEKRQALMDLAKITRLLPADRLEHSGSIEHTVRPEHKIDIEAMAPEEREQLRAILLKAVGCRARRATSSPRNTSRHTNCAAFGGADTPYGQRIETAEKPVL